MQPGIDFDLVESLPYGGTAGDFLNLRMLDEFEFFYTGVNDITLAIIDTDNIEVIVYWFGESNAWPAIYVILYGQAAPVFFGENFALVSDGRPQVNKEVGFAIYVTPAVGVGIG
jgi:hypothetical protein